MTHGSKSHREHGSIGSSTTPSRVFPGLKMAGHMGAVRRTSKKQEVSKASNMSSKCMNQVHMLQSLVDVPDNQTSLMSQILKIDLERKAIVLKGSLAGKTGSVVEVTPAKLYEKVVGLIGAPRK